ncbi:MAG TPA: hypothetical protein DCS60_06825 [Opitutae bacterium]|nr:hypothetical protein [Opitutae bacterium]
MASAKLVLRISDGFNSSIPSMSKVIENTPYASKNVIEDAGNISNRIRESNRRYGEFGPVQI